MASYSAYEKKKKAAGKKPLSKAAWEKRVANLKPPKQGNLFGSASKKAAPKKPNGTKRASTTKKSSGSKKKAAPKKSAYAQYKAKGGKKSLEAWKRSIGPAKAKALGYKPAKPIKPTTTKLQKKGGVAPRTETLVRAAVREKGNKRTQSALDKLLTRTSAKKKKGKPINVKPSRGKKVYTINVARSNKTGKFVKPPRKRSC